jgi:hypothetical protein
VSNGVKKIEAFLIANNYKFKKEYRIQECRNILPLPFDFALFNNKNLLCLIEYNGEQHYIKVRKFGGKKAFASQQKRDQIKIEFCSKNNIDLIIIPHWDCEKIEDILTERLKNDHTSSD